MSEVLIEKALALWGVHGATTRFVAGRENRIYKVDTENGAFALRVKRPGLRHLDELDSELHWMAEMARAGLSVPVPLPSKNGSFIRRVDGVYVDLLTWLSGAPMGASRTPLQLDDTIATFHKLGTQMADMHRACDAWTVPEGFRRVHWDSNGLLGEDPLWGRFWDNPTLNSVQKSLFKDFRRFAITALNGAFLDQGLIHADLVRENVLLDGERMHFIDFDDGGFGYRLFDLATALIKNRDEPNYADLKDALLAGYLSRRDLDCTVLDLFIALRACTYVGWIVPRMGEGTERNTRYIATAEVLCTDYLNQHT